MLYGGAYGDRIVDWLKTDWAKTLCALLAFVALAEAKPKGKPTTFLLDISETVGYPVAIQYKTKGEIWQLPLRLLRKGFGMAFYAVPDDEASQTYARIYIEVEPLEKPLKEASLQMLRDLKDTLAPANTELVGEGEVTPPADIKFDHMTREACQFSYTVRVLDALPAQDAQARAVAFDVGKAFISVTVECFSTDETDAFYEKTLKSLKLVTPPKKPKKTPIKLVDATRRVYRFTRGTLPDGFLPDAYECPEGLTARYSRRDPKSGKVLARIEIDASDYTPRVRTLTDEVDWRLSDAQDAYEKASSKEPIRVGGLDGFHFSFRDPGEDEDADPTHVSRIYLHVHDHVWGLTYRTAATEDERQRKKNKAELERILKSLKIWHAKPNG